MRKANAMKAAAVAAPRDRAEAEQLLAEIGSLQRQVGRLEDRMNDQLTKMKKTTEDLARPLNAQIAVKFQALHVWAEANRAGLCRGRAKTARLATGEVSWRMTPPAVRVRGVAAVIGRLKRLGLADLLRSKEEINKEAILADPKRVEGIEGIAIAQREEFVAKPFESQIERAEPAKAVEREQAA